MGVRLTTEQFIEKANLKHNQTEVKYIYKKVKYICIKIKQVLHQLVLMFQFQVLGQ